MLGKTNIGNGGLRQYDVVCYYWGQRPNAESGVATQGRQYAYNQGYLSFDSSTQKFTVLKDFEATVKVVGTGARTGTTGSAGRYPLTVSFYVNSSIKISASGINENGSNTPSATAYSFKTGDVFWVQGSHSINVYPVDIGFIVEIA